MILGEDKWLLFTGRHFWNRKCRKKTWWQQEFAVFKCEAAANSVTGHVCANSNTRQEIEQISKTGLFFWTKKLIIKGSPS